MRKIIKYFIFCSGTSLFALGYAQTDLMPLPKITTKHFPTPKITKQFPIPKTTEIFPVPSKTERFTKPKTTEVFPVPRKVERFAKPMTIKYYPAHVDLGGYYLGRTPHGAGLMDWFLPIGQNYNQLFVADLRFLDKTGIPWEGNVGLIYRQVDLAKQRLFGFYTYYDRQRSLKNNYFNELTFGWEFWLENMFVGANAYIPVGRSTYIDPALNAVDLRQAGAFRNIFYGVGIDTAIPGADVEIGTEVIKGITAYFGTYYYKSFETPVVWGPLARLRCVLYRPYGRKILGIFNQFTLEGQVQYDSPRGTTWYAGGRLMIEFGKETPVLKGIMRHMIDPPLRDIDVVGLNTHKPFQRLNKPNGDPVLVSDVNSSAQLVRAAVNTNVDVIAAHDTITGIPFTALSNSQTITGNRYFFTAEGQNFTAFVSSGSTLQAAAAGNLLQLTVNNTVRDLTLNVDANSGDQVISNDNAILDMGSNLIDNVNANGRILLIRDAAGTVGSVAVVNSIVNTGTAATGAGTTIGAVQFDADNGGNFTISNLQRNSISTSGNNFRGLLSDVNNASTITFQRGIHDNVISATGAAANSNPVFIAVADQNNSDSSTLIVNGGFYNNILTSTLGNAVSTTIGSGSGDTNTLTINGGFYNNTISSTTGNAVFNNIDNGNTNSITINGGFFSNAITTTTGVGVSNDVASSNNSSTNNLIFNGGFFSNTISGAGNGVVNSAASTNNSTENNIIFYSGFFNNTITSTANNGVVCTAGTGNTGVNDIVTFQGNITNNTITAAANGFTIGSVANQGSIIIDGLFSNTIAAGGTGIALDVEAVTESNISIIVNSDAVGLSASNGGATVTGPPNDRIHLVPAP